MPKQYVQDSTNTDPIKGTPTIKGTEVRFEDGWRIEKPIEDTNSVNTDLQLKKTLNNLRGKHIKQLLSQLEKLNILDIVVRKIVLDALNDYARDVNKELGYDDDTAK